MSTPDDLPGSVHVAADPAATAAELAAWVAGRSREAIARRGAHAIALCGGSTPRLLYATLRQPPHRDAVDWRRQSVWFGDERAVDPDDERSNAHLARLLLDHVPVDATCVHRMEGERPDLDAAAADYAALLERELPPGPAGAPRLDTLLLGLGENGHTASLFPGDPSLDVDDRWAVRSRADYAPFERITVTFPTIRAAAAIAFGVTGSGKAAAFADVIAGRAPAARARPTDGELHWFLDAAAAASIR